MTRKGRAGTVLAIILGAMAGAWTGGLLLFVTDLSAPTEELEYRTDAVVVLTGGSERLAKGVALLEEGRGRKLFVSGVHKGVDLPDVLRQVHPHSGDLSCCIVLGHAADDTIGNAAETAAWMEAEHFTSLRLVTASYHMRRALLEFRRAMPETTIVPHRVFPDAVKTREWWRWPGTLHLLATEYTKYLGALARPLFLPKPVERKP